MRLVLFAILLLLWSCGRDPKVPASLRSELASAYQVKLEELRSQTLSHAGGWPSDIDCDAALWAGLARAGGADWVEVSSAIRDDGRPTRLPGEDCLPPRSAATTSNDMLTGIMLGLVEAGDGPSLSRLWDY